MQNIFHWGFCSFNSDATISTAFALVKTTVVDIDAFLILFSNSLEEMGSVLMNGTTSIEISLDSASRMSSSSNDLVDNMEILFCCMFHLVNDFLAAPR